MLDPLSRFRTEISYPLLTAALIALMGCAGSVRADEDDRPVSIQDGNSYEMDRPGEIENPFVLPPGQAQLVDYLVAMNAASREDEFDYHASAVVLNTAVWLGIANRIDGEVAVDTFLDSNVERSRGGGSTSGLGDATFALKWDFCSDRQGEFGFGVAPFVRIPLQREIAGTSRSEAGLIFPFEVDIEGGWELQGSTGVARSPDGRRWSTEYQNQVELERALFHGLNAYLELELESGEGLPLWSAETGITAQITRAVRFDLGASHGLGRASRGCVGYAGIGWHF